MKKSVKYVKLVLNIVIPVTGIILLCYFGPKVLRFFMPFVIGWIISMIANPLVRFLERKVKILRKHSSAILIVAVLALIILGIYFLITKLGSEMAGLISDLPKMYQLVEKEFLELGQSLSKYYDMVPAELQEKVADFTNSVGEAIAGVIQNLGGPTVEAAGIVAKNVSSILVSLVITILSAYFFTADRDKIVAVIKKYTPKGIQDKIKFMLDNIKYAVGGYFKAQFKIMGVVVVILLAGFLLLHVKYAILLALLIAFLDFLPFFGTGTALCPWALVAFLSKDYKLAIGLLVLYAVSQIVRQLIQPKIVGDSMGINPLMTLILLYIGFKWNGVFGMIVAVPVGMVVINMFKIGMFDSILFSIREIAEDINEFRKIEFKKAEKRTEKEDD